ncbi:MAG: SUMF1/EgtB/PvdO family nonheme iron enzyme [Prevotella sp.]|nr:SUMF1/EgtB/PvdO family nonheme iron enzyme [Prevotella sp.]
MKKLVYMLIALLAFTACSSDELMPSAPNANTHHRVKMRLVGGLNGFDHSTTNANTRAEATDDWKVGDIIYLTLSNSTHGTATYTNDGWVVDYEGSLTSGEGQNCTAYYFEKVKSRTDYLVQLLPTSATYKAQGTYNYMDGELTLYANLKPTTGRVRFKGTVGSKVYVAGPVFASSYTPSTNTLNTGLTTAILTVDESGYTPYIYGEFETIAMGHGENPTTHNISIACGEVAYTRTFTNDLLNVGKSGYITVPTEAAHSGWRIGFTIRLKSYDFKELELKMMPVTGFTSGYFMLGETEVTKRQYESVIDHSTDISQANYPKNYLSYDKACGFVYELIALTGLNFYIPTEEEWLYAARGGKLSQGYTYAGSNNANEVAWTSENANGDTHEVKTKMPNELGLYDMSGNVWEFTAPIKGDYNSYLHLQGGSYYESKNSSSIGNYIYENSYVTSDSRYGLRVALYFD